MSAKPLRNGKGVNKAFCSPFTKVNTPQHTNTKNDSNTPETHLNKTSSRNSISKRLLFVQTPPSKRLCLSDTNSTNFDQDRKLCHSDLDALKIRVKEKQKCIDKLNMQLLYKKKNKAEDLEAAIKKWTITCQDALTDYQNHLKETCDHSTNMTDILGLFGIDHSLVHFSPIDDRFY